MLFQFQLGTIGTIGNNAVEEVVIGFQFQLGTIGTFQDAVRAALVQISIPVRYDWNHDCVSTHIAVP